MFAVQWLDIASTEVGSESPAAFIAASSIRRSPTVGETSSFPTGPGRAAAAGPLDRVDLYWQAGGRLSQSSLAYYWRGTEGAFGRKVALHELKHFAGHYLYVILGLPDRVVAEQLGHRDGGKLVRELWTRRRWCAGGDRPGPSHRTSFRCAGLQARSTGRSVAPRSPP